MPDDQEAPLAEPRGSLASLLLSLFVALAMIGVGVAILDAWIHPGIVPGARAWSDPWPLAFLALLVVLLAAAVVRRAPASCWGLAATAWCVGAIVVSELPLAESSHRMGDGPFLIPLYLAITLGTGLYAVAGPRSHGPGLRAVALLLVWTACNGKLFTRAHEPLYPVLFGAAALAFGCHAGGLRPGRLLTGAARPLVLVVALFVAWLMLASVLGESPATGLTYTARTLTGVLLAWTLAACLDRRGVERAYDVLLVGLALCLVVVAAGVLQTANACGWERTLVTRLRFFGQHPGLVAPFLAVGICLCAARALAPPRQLSGSGGLLERAAFLLLAGATAWCLVLNEARASLLGACAGIGALALLVVATRLRLLPRRPLRWGLGFLAVVAVAVGAFLSPLGNGVRASFETLTHTSSAWGQRYHWWQAAARATAENPILGLGPRCEWARARLVESSHLDGQDQGTHAHDIFLSLSEGAGVPAAVLYLLILLGVLELARRAILGAEERGDAGGRMLAAGLASAVVAVTTANLLSMGQAWKTLTPLFVWIALGLLAALVLVHGRAKGGVEERGGALHHAVAGLLALVFFVSPAASYALLLSARNLASVGDTDAALERVALARTIDPRSLYADSNERDVHLTRRDFPEALEVARRMVEDAPRNAQNRLVLGNVYLASGDLVAAKENYELAAELDPWGHNRAEHLTSRARVYLLLGLEAQARELLLEAMALRGTPLRRVRVPLPPLPNDPPGLRRYGFRLGEPGSNEYITLDSLLEELERDLFELAASDDPQDRTEARWRLGQIYDHRRAQGQGDQVMAMFDRYAEVVPERYSNVDVLYVRLLVEHGRWAEARELLDRHEGNRNLFTAYCVMLDRMGGEEELAELARCFENIPDGMAMADIWFQAGDMADYYGALARYTLGKGDVEPAFAHLDAAIYDRYSAPERASSARRFLERAVELDLGNEVLARAAERFVLEASLDRVLARNGEVIAGVANTLAEGWNGEAGALWMEMESRVASMGVAGRNLLAALGQDPQDD